MTDQEDESLPPATKMEEDRPSNEESRDSSNDAGNAESEEQNVYEWSAYYHDDGNLYYYNERTGESSWDPPEKFNPPPPPESEGLTQQEDVAPQENIDAGRGADADNDENEKQPMDAKVEEEPTLQQEQDEEEQQKSKSQAGEADAWIAYQDEEGREYYYNSVTNETTWDKPERFVPAEEVVDTVEDEGKAECVSPERAQSPVPMDQDVPSDNERELQEEKPEDQPAEPEEKEEEIDPAVKRLQEAEAALNMADAIMEPGIMDHVTEVVTSQDGNPQKAIQALIESYHGQTAICGLLGLWLADLRAGQSATDPEDQNKEFQRAAGDIRQMAQDVVHCVAKERFTKTGGDSILNLKRSEAVFLESMMDSRNWRKLLIDLSASNKDSALLMYCLQAISKRGHHREIAKRVNQSDHFAVFNAMLASELTVVGKIAVSACTDTDTSIGLEELVGDLSRYSTSTAYTYIYAIEVLRHLVSTAKEAPFASASEARSSRFPCAIRKWERLTEDLQSTMIDPMSPGSSSPLFKRRRLNVALTVSELHQRQRRRLRHNADDDDDAYHHMSNGNNRASVRLAEVETAVLNFMRRYSMGTQVDDKILDAMLPKNEIGGDTSNTVGKLLIKRPLSVRALLGYLFEPGQRVNSKTARNKCARLIALSMLAAESEAVAEMQHRNSSQTPRSDEVAVTRTLLQGSEICETLENMVSFVVVTAIGKTGPSASPGEQLCALAIKCAPVAQGVIMWARKNSSSNEFVNSASYPTVSPSILSLVRIVTLQHPFTRREALEVALGFLRHSNADISYQKMNEIKEQILRLLIFLAVHGESPTVLAGITLSLKQQGSSFMDASLIRYFVGGLLEVVNVSGSFSIPFVRSIATLLKTPVCAESVRSQYFGEENKKRLSLLMTSLHNLLNRHSPRGVTSEEAALITSLVSTYAL